MPPFFDSTDWSDPKTMAAMQSLASLSGAFADGGMPSATPIPFGSTLGHAGAAALQGGVTGAKNAQAFSSGQQQLAKGKQELQQGNLGMAQTLSAMNYYRAKAGLPPLQMSDLGNPNLSLAAPAAAASPPPSAIPQAPPPGAPAPQADNFSPIFSDPNTVIPALRSAESGDDPNAVSPKGARGTMQVMPTTAANPGFGVAPGAGSDQQGQQYFQAMLQKYNGNMTRAIVAYNWGPGNTDKWIAGGADPKKLPAETRQLIGTVAAGVPITRQPPAQEAAPDSGTPPSPTEGIDQLGLFNPAKALEVQSDWMKPHEERPGGATTALDPKTGRVITYHRNPTLPESATVDDNGNVSMLPGGAAAIGTAENAKEMAKIPAKQTMANYENYLEYGDASRGTAEGGLKPSAGAPVVGQPVPGLPPGTATRTAQGTALPTISQAAPINSSEAYLKTRVPQWAHTEDEWNNALPSGVIAEQRALAISDALKQTQSGAWADEKSDIAAKLKSVGIVLPNNILGDPAEVQKVLKNNFQSTLQQIRAFSSRPAAIEVQLAAKNFANPNLQPEANQQIIAETVGTLRWERAMLNDWADAKKQGWQDPQDFQRVWTKLNPIQGFVDGATHQIGPLKGMVDADVQRQITPETLAAGAKARGMSLDDFKAAVRAKGYKVP